MVDANDEEKRALKKEALGIINDALHNVYIKKMACKYYSQAINFLVLMK